MKKSKHLSRLVSKPVLFAAALLAIAILGIAGFGVHRVTAQTVEDCSNNSIIKCGAHTPTDFINKLQANNPPDLQAIYSDFTLTPDKYADFEQNAKMGTAYKNGTIVVNGETVATDSWSIGREKKPYSTDDVIAGHTYYKSYSKDVFAVDSIPAMVYFNKDGNIQFAVLTACGNPLGGTPVTTKKASCDMLQKTAVSGQDNTYQFTTKATTVSGSRISRVVYDFGDGSGTVTQSDATTAVTHTYSTPGTFTAKVTVFVVNASGNEVALTAATCQTQITVQQPTPPPADVACTNLQATVDPHNYLAYTFTATTTATNATLRSADFDFGDGMTAPGVGPVAAAPTTAAAQHTYAAAGTYRIRATVHFDAANTNNTTNTTATPTTTTTTTATPTTTMSSSPTRTTVTPSDGSYTRTTVTPATNSATRTTVTPATSSATRTTVTPAGTTTTTAQNGQVTQQTNQTNITVRDATCATTITINAPAPVTPAATTPQPTAPELPKTGPAGVAGLFGGASAIGAIGYRLRLRRKTNLLDRLVERAHRDQ